MPRGDRTGPTGAGPRTGRAAGYCAGNNAPGFANWAPGFGGGMGFGRGRGFAGSGFAGVGFAGRGRGWRNRCFATGVPGAMAPSVWGPPMAMDPDAEKQALQSRANALQAEIEAIRKRLDEMETKTSE